MRQEPRGVEHSASMVLVWPLFVARIIRRQINQTENLNQVLRESVTKRKPDLYRDVSIYRSEKKFSTDSCRIYISDFFGLTGKVCVIKTSNKFMSSNVSQKVDNRTL